MTFQTGDGEAGEQVVEGREFRPLLWRVALFNQGMQGSVVGRRAGSMGVGQTMKRLECQDEQCGLDSLGDGEL